MILATTGLGSCLLIAAVLGYIMATFSKEDSCPLGLEDTHSHSSPSHSQPTAVPVTSASSLVRPLPTTLFPDPSGVATASRTYGRLTAAATAGEVTDPSNGSVPATARTSYIPNSQPSSGISLAADPLDTTRQPVRFFSSKKNPALP